MHQTDLFKYGDMNLQTDAVIANQADICAFSEQTVGEHRVRFVTTDTRGTSLNRNLALAYAKADYVLFADDDMRFVDGYEQIVEDTLKQCPDADAIKFYAESTNPLRPMSYKRAAALKKTSVRNMMSAGIHALLVKRSFLTDHDLSFPENIGPGRKIYCGEDSVFLRKLLAKGAKIYESPELVAYVRQEESSWFRGYTEQHFVSCGYVYARTYGLLAPLVIVRRAVNTKKRKDCTSNMAETIRLMLQGFRMGRKDR